MNEREALERIAKYPMSRSEEMSIETAREIAREALASQAQQESKLHWCGTCEQNVERGCGDSACQYRYKLPPVPMNEVNKPEGE